MSAQTDAAAGRTTARPNGASYRVEPLAQHVLRHRERRKQPDAVAVQAGAHHDDTVGDGLPDDPERDVGARRLFRLAVSHEFSEHHRTESAHVADDGPLRLPAFHHVAHDVAEVSRVRKELGLSDDRDRFNGRRAGDRAAAVGAANAAQVRRIHDLGSTRDGRDRHAGAERLGNRDEVRDDAVVLDREEAARAAHATLHFVGHHHDAVLRAQLADPLQESRRHRNESGFALHGFDDHGGDCLGIDLGDERMLELSNSEVDVLILGHAWRRAVHVRNRQANDLRVRTVRSRS